MKHPLNKFVWCKIAPSKIHGVGLIAIRNIPKGTYLFGGQNEYASKEGILPEIMDIILDHHSRVEYWDMIPNPNKDVWLQCFMNHSDTPNSFEGITLCGIMEGQEITEDYRKGKVPLGQQALNHFNFL